MYFKKLSYDLIVYLLLYIYNMLIVSKNMSKFNNFNDQLSGEFEMKNLGIPKKILGIEIHKD